MENRKSLLLQHQAIIFVASEGRKDFELVSAPGTLPIRRIFPLLFLFKKDFSVKESLKEIPSRRWNVLPSPPFHFWWTARRPPVRLPESLNSITLDISPSARRPLGVRPSAAVAQSREEDLTSESVGESRVRESLPPSPLS